MEDQQKIHYLFLPLVVWFLTHISLAFAQTQCTDGFCGSCEFTDDLCTSREMCGEGEVCLFSDNRLGDASRLITRVFPATSEYLGTEYNIATGWWHTGIWSGRYAHYTDNGDASLSVKPILVSGQSNWLYTYKHSILRQESAIL